MEEVWPDRSLPYDYPLGTPENQRRWQAGIDRGLAAGSLEMTPKGQDLYDLHGACPRCGHPLSVEIEFDVVFGIDPVGPRTGRYNVDCTCDEKHDGRDDDRAGCGWGGPLAVSITEG